jgi:hypothetical protein
MGTYTFRSDLMDAAVMGGGFSRVGQDPIREVTERRSLRRSSVSTALPGARLDG